MDVNVPYVGMYVSQGLVDCVWPWAFEGGTGWQTHTAHGRDNPLYQIYNCIALHTCLNNL